MVVIDDQMATQLFNSGRDGEHWGKGQSIVKDIDGCLMLFKTEEVRRKLALWKPQKSDTYRLQGVTLDNLVQIQKMATA